MLIPFDIPSQPLEDALYAFDAATGIEVVADGRQVAGRRSAPVKGLLPPELALRALLFGTGLDAQKISADAITLSPKRTPDGALYRQYSALIQDAVVRRLCREPETRPGSFRAAMRLWLDQSGTISDADLLDSTGDPVRDRRLHEILIGSSVGTPPPSALPEPVIVVVLPRLPEVSGDCL